MQDTANYLSFMAFKTSTPPSQMKTELKVLSFPMPLALTLSMETGLLGNGQSNSASLHELMWDCGLVILHAARAVGPGAGTGSLV